MRAAIFHEPRRIEAGERASGSGRGGPALADAPTRPRRPAPGDMSRRIPRRDLLRLTAAGVAGTALGVQLSGCGGDSPNGGRTEATPTEPSAGGRDTRVLLVYFSRAGENYWNG